MTTTHLKDLSLPPAPVAPVEAPAPAAPLDPSITPGTPEFLARPTCERLLIYCDRWRHWLLGITLAALLLGFNGQWRPEPDSALYLTIGRNLVTGHGYSYMGSHNDLAYPGLPWLIAGVFKVFGTDNLVAVHAAVFAFALAALALTYALVHLYAGRGTAVLVTGMTGLCATFYRYSFQIRNDMPFLAGVMAFLVGYELISEGARSRSTIRTVGAWVLMIAGLALAVVMRPNMWALLAAICVAATWSVIRQPRLWRRLVLILLVAGIVVATFLALDPRRLGAGFSLGTYEDSVVGLATHRLGELFHQIFARNVRDLFEPKIAEALLGTPVLIGINTLFGIGALALGIGLARRRLLWGLWIAATLVLVCIVLPAPRYLLAILPLLALAWWKGMESLNYRLGEKWGRPALIILFALWIGPNAVASARFAYEQRKRPFSAGDRVDRSMTHLHELGRMIRENVPAETQVLVQRKIGRIETYLSDRSVLEPQMIRKWNLSPPAYVLEPFDAEVAATLQSCKLQAGPVVATASTWKLRKTIPAP